MKTNYKELKEFCEKESRISADVIDNFLIGYAAQAFKLEKEMKSKFAKYKHITRTLPKELFQFQLSQYIAHRIFKDGGLIEKLLNHSIVQNLTSTEVDFLKRIANQKWRFSFSVMLDNPAEDFFIMEDIFTNEKYLLYSKATSTIQESQSTEVWFNLITDNGYCCVTYGSIGAFRGFFPNDIFFYFTELIADPEFDFDNGDAIQENIEQNPVPYMMLLSGANYPITASGDDILVNILTEYDASSLDTNKIGTEFKKEYNSGVYKLAYKNMDIPPHFAAAFYDENLKIILLTAQTKTGYDALVRALNKYGLGYEFEPAIIVSFPMLITAKEILKREIVLNEYESLFRVETPPEKSEVVDNMNEAFQEIMPLLNAGKRPDLKAIAKKYNLDEESLKDVVDDLWRKLGR